MNAPYGTVGCRPDRSPLSLLRGLVLPLVVALIAPSGAACDAASECTPASPQGELVAAFDGYTGPFTLAVRLDSALNLRGYAYDLGPAAAVDEVSARAAADAVASHGERFDSAESLGLRAGQWVFSLGAGDETVFAFVSNRTGHAVLGLSVAWVAFGTVTAPLSWGDPAELGHTCGTPLTLGAVDELSSTTAPSSAKTRAAVRAAVQRTALGELFTAPDAVAETLVIEVPRNHYSAGTDPAEWVVLLSGTLDAAQSP